MPEFDSQEIEDYIKSILQGIEKGTLKEKGSLWEYPLSGEIEFELAVVTEKGEGGLKLSMVDAKGGTSKKNVSKIKFKVKQQRATQEGLNWESLTEEEREKIREASRIMRKSRERSG